jgi:hypothetical protein
MKIEVIAKPGKKSAKIEIKDGVYHVDIDEKAVEGKANSALIKMLAKHFKTSSANVRIIRGFSSHKKLIEIK